LQRYQADQDRDGYLHVPVLRVQRQPLEELGVTQSDGAGVAEALGFGLVAHGMDPDLADAELLFKCVVVDQGHLDKHLQEKVEAGQTKQVILNRRNHLPL